MEWLEQKIDQVERRWPVSTLAGTLIWMLLLLFVTVGCAAGIRTSLLEVEGRVASPRLGWGETRGTALAVVYPAAAPTVLVGGGVDGGGGGMVENFGSAWQNLEPVYREYRFNPFNP